MNTTPYESRQFTNLHLTEETVKDAVFTACTFTGCSFENVTLVQCRFAECTFQKCRIAGVKSQYSEFRSTQFNGCDLGGINWQQLLPNDRFGRAIESMTGCRLRYNTFMQMPLKKLDFAGCEMVESLFQECELNDSSFYGCTLSKTEFTQCDLRGVDLREATGYVIDPATNRLRGARFSYPEVVSLLMGLGIRID